MKWCCAWMACGLTSWLTTCFWYRHCGRFHTIYTHIVWSSWQQSINLWVMIGSVYPYHSTLTSIPNWQQSFLSFKKAFADNWKRIFLLYNYRHCVRLDSRTINGDKSHTHSDSKNTYSIQTVNPFNIRLVAVALYVDGSQASDGSNWIWTIFTVYHKYSITCAVITQKEAQLYSLIFFAIQISLLLITNL